MKKDSMRTWRCVAQKEAAHFATLCSDLFGDSPARPSPGFIVAIASSSVRSFVHPSPALYGLLDRRLYETAP